MVYFVCFFDNGDLVDFRFINSSSDLFPFETASKIGYFLSIALVLINVPGKANSLIKGTEFI